VIQDFPGPLEADLLEFFGVDLMDLWRHKLSLRRIHVLVQSLMLKRGRSAVLAAIDEANVWGTTEYLLARVSDALELSNFLFIRANSSKSDDMPLPDPIPRPGAPVVPPKPAAEFASGEEVASFFTRMSAM